MGTVTKTRDHNINILLEHGFKKFSNTTVFHKGSLSIISPAVAENSAGTYWFDLRKVNLKRLSSNSYILIRIVPNLFVLQSLEYINSLLTPALMDNRPNSGDVWGIKMGLNKNNMTAALYNLKASNQKISVKLLSIEKVGEELKNIG
jgi:hypothetical protein